MFARRSAHPVTGGDVSKHVTLAAEMTPPNRRVYYDRPKLSTTSRRLIFILLVNALITSAGAAQSVREGVFPPARHAELRKEIVFTPPKMEEEEPIEISDEELWSVRDIDLPRPVLYGILGGLLALLGFLVYRILNGLDLRRRVTKKDPEEDYIRIEEIEEEVLVAGGVSLSLQERAEKAGQYDVAVRLLYIQLLKDLQDNGHIKYRRDYSNRDYRHQLRANELLPGYGDVTIDYERYWYGKYAIDPLSYRLVKRKFTALTDQARQTGQQTTTGV